MNVIPAWVKCCSFFLLLFFPVSFCTAISANEFKVRGRVLDVFSKRTTVKNASVIVKENKKRVP